ncbi:Lrp/AsnC family transcriptional regulator [Propionivibrio sp.]|uniref:siroheme decarboxylase subunit beta n=1 Tax=Propionivibrio sp. TaxID=2212460 RepID=UPI0025DD7436|nr:Lrp/AsnC family transcriptional regulator [Propionivibrio sp.]MBK7355909.1 Lrp/AsnC family transcriptional regulator [Propionivibrio sp.]MBK8400432.1 Lrp/AsnC family transcriptional regulator [Propionivibrio sp.]MBK8743884.1 Lrp/AsnC family transcriptional regulator [Propionivibrio sp.]MBK8895320.1 Lrp/AsnC family transcriptional regulator [Propionivibrio sp.]MBL0208749.1 Lrp/AsnC family transcriptional regulator [Propionivibrio sp.]
MSIASGDDRLDSDIDRRLVLATQGGLPLVPRPYEQLGEQLGIPADEVMTRLSRMLERGVIRRIGVVPNHYAIGYTANGMSVWDVPDERVDELGERIGELEFVTHCYHRPRSLPEWPYNLFAMTHGSSREEVWGKVERIATLLGADCRAYDVLFSTRILKKTGLRIGG